MRRGSPGQHTSSAPVESPLGLALEAAELIGRSIYADDGPPSSPRFTSPRSVFIPNLHSPPPTHHVHQNHQNQIMHHSPDKGVQSSSGSKRLSRKMRSLSGLALKRSVAKDDDKDKIKDDSRQKELAEKKRRKDNAKDNQPDKDKVQRDHVTDLKLKDKKDNKGEKGKHGKDKDNKGSKRSPRDRDNKTGGGGEKEVETNDKGERHRDKDNRGEERGKKEQRRAAEKERKAAAKKEKKEEKRRAQLKSQLSVRGSMRRTPRIKTFGATLRSVLSDNPQCCVPPFVEQACLYIEQTMLDVEGIFRKTGIKDEARKWRDFFNVTGYLEWSKLREDIVVPDLLRMYLRELPDPLLTYELYDCFLAKAKSFRTTGMLLDLRGLVPLIPRRNLLLLKRLIITLRMVREHAEKNLMDENNLGVIFGPNLLRAPADSSVDLFTDFEYVNAITLSMIVDYDVLMGDVEYKPYYLCHVRAKQDYTPLSNGEILLHKGDVILVTVTDKSGWWLGEMNGEIGRFPIHCCTFLDGTDCINGYAPLGIPPSEADGRLPRQTRIVDAKSIANLRSPRGGAAVKGSSKHPQKAKSDSNSLRPHKSKEKEEPDGSLATENPHISPAENVTSEGAATATEHQQNGGQDKGDFFAFG